jgi:hypothetical protein
MKLIIMMLLVSCASDILMVNKNTYQAKCSKVYSSCEEKIKKVCPNGHKITTQDSQYSGWGGPKDIIYFQCANKK